MLTSSMQQLCAVSFKFIHIHKNVYFASPDFNAHYMSVFSWSHDIHMMCVHKDMCVTSNLNVEDIFIIASHTKSHDLFQ